MKSKYRRYQLICRTCGGEINQPICQYCETNNQVDYYTKSQKKYITVNLEVGMPSVEDAKRKVESSIVDAKIQGAKIIKFIHGYGSSGVGGDIKFAVRQYLHRNNKGTTINGEDFSTDNIKIENILKKYPKLRHDNAINRKNKGITLLIIN